MLKEILLPEFSRNPLINLLPEKSATYIHAMCDYLESDEDLNLFEVINQNEYLLHFRNPEETVLNLNDRIIKLQQLEQHPQKIDNQKIHSMWDIANISIEQHKDLLSHNKIEAFFFGSMIFGHPDKGDLDLIFGSTQIVPDKVYVLLENTIASHLAIGADIRQTSLIRWITSINKYESQPTDIHAYDAFFDTAYITDTLYGIPYGLQSTTFLDSYRSQLIKIATQYPIFGALMMVRLEYAYNRVMTRRGINT